MSERYCKFAGSRRYFCSHEPEMRKTDFCRICRVAKLVNQQDPIIKQNKAIILLLNQTRDLLAELRDIRPETGLSVAYSQKDGKERTHIVKVPTEHETSRRYPQP